MLETKTKKTIGVSAMSRNDKITERTFVNTYLDLLGCTLDSSANRLIEKDKKLVRNRNRLTASIFW